MPEGFEDLPRRLLSGLVLGAVATAAIIFGALWFALFVSVIVGVMAWEYRSILTSNDGGFWRRDLFFPLLVALCPMIAHVEGELTPALLLLAGAAIATAGIERGEGRDWRWTTPGLVLLGSAGACLVVLRAQPLYGLETVVWLVAVVVATDVGGYFAGRLLGGPKLAPVLSPKKTWAGLVGGVTLAALVGAWFSAATSGTYFEEVSLVSMVAAVVAQGGDLAESAVKRRFGVKDSSGLIPGHGGALDRFDGLLAATLVAAAVTFARGKEVFASW
ncbi:MAG: phosphatidate cytidylyltransferase [Pseudomonadota bacterium]